MPSGANQAPSQPANPPHAANRHLRPARPPAPGGAQQTLHLCIALLCGLHHNDASGRRGRHCRLRGPSTHILLTAAAAVLTAIFAAGWLRIKVQLGVGWCRSLSRAAAPRWRLLCLPLSTSSGAARQLTALW